MCCFVKQKLFASGVSRFKICAYELGSGSLSLAQQRRIRAALEAELQATPMLRDDGELDEPEYPCHVCRRSFGSHASLEDHLAVAAEPLRFATSRALFEARLELT